MYVMLSKLDKSSLSSTPTVCKASWTVGLDSSSVLGCFRVLPYAVSFLASPFALRGPLKFPDSVEKGNCQGSDDFLGMIQMRRLADLAGGGEKKPACFRNFQLILLCTTPIHVYNRDDTRRGVNKP